MDDKTDKPGNQWETKFCVLLVLSFTCPLYQHTYQQFVGMYRGYPGARGIIKSGKTEAPQSFLGFAGLAERENWWVVQGSNLRLTN